MEVECRKEGRRLAAGAGMWAPGATRGLCPALPCVLGGGAGDKGVRRFDPSSGRPPPLAVWASPAPKWECSLSALPI